MRRFDKNKNIKKANLLAEQRYLESKGIIKENIEEEYYDSRKEVENYVDAEEIKGKHLWFHTNRTHKNNGWNGMIGIYQSTPNGRKTGSPIAYTNEVRITSPIYFQTSESGSDRIKKTGHRVLIAGVSGVVTDTRPGDTSGMELATFNPFEAGVFHLVNDSDEKEIVSADEVYFHASEDGKWSFFVKGPKFANENQTIPAEQPGEEAIAEDSSIGKFDLSDEANFNQLKDMLMNYLHQGRTNSAAMANDNKAILYDYLETMWSPQDLHMGADSNEIRTNNPELMSKYLAKNGITGKRFVK